VPVDNKIEVAGVKEALAELNKTQKKLRRAITVEYKEIMQPTVSKARNLVPTDAPLSGFNRAWTPNGGQGSVLPFQGGGQARAPRLPTAREINFPGGRRQYGNWLKWQAGLNAYISGKRPRTIGNYTRNLAAFGIKWQGPAAVLFDTSGQANTPQGRQMVSALTAKYGPPSRVMWRAYQQTDQDVQNQLKELVRKIMRSVNEAVR